MVSEASIVDTSELREFIGAPWPQRDPLIPLNLLMVPPKPTKFFKYQWEVKCGTNFPTSGPDEFIGLEGLPWAPVNLFHLPPKPPVFFKWKWDINCFTKLIPLEGTEKQQSHQTTKLLNNQTAKTTCNQTNKELYNQMIKYPNDLGGAEKIIWLRGFQICETLDASMSFGELGGLRGT